MMEYNIHPIDMLLYRDEFGRQDLCAIFNEENLIKKWRIVNAAVARAEA